MNENQNNFNSNQSPSGGPQFGPENQGQGGWGKKLRGWLNKYGSSVILPIVALLILAGGIYLYASQQEQAAGLPQDQNPPSATSTNGELDQDVTETNKKENKDKEDQADETNKEKQQKENQKQEDKDSQKEEPSQKQEVIKDGKIIEIAEKGEGVTHLARKAAKNYLKNKDKKLTKEQKVYVEDYLKDKVGSRPLEVGEKVTFSKKQIQDAIDASLQLNQNQLKNLEKYSQHINW